MKTNKFVEELKNKSANELNEELVAAKKELFNLRFQNATNQLDNTSRIKFVRTSLVSRLLSLRRLMLNERRTYRGKKFKKNPYR